jgi:hypothetical protein
MTNNQYKVTLSGATTIVLSCIKLYFYFVALICNQSRWVVWWFYSCAGLPDPPRPLLDCFKQIKCNQSRWVVCGGGGGGGGVVVVVVVWWCGGGFFTLNITTLEIVFHCSRLW